MTANPDRGASRSRHGLDGSDNYHRIVWTGHGGHIHLDKRRVESDTSERIVLFTSRGFWLTSCFTQIRFVDHSYEWMNLIYPALSSTPILKPASQSDCRWLQIWSVRSIGRTHQHLFPCAIQDFPSHYSASRFCASWLLASVKNPPSNRTHRHHASIDSIGFLCGTIETSSEVKDNDSWHTEGGEELMSGTERARKAAVFKARHWCLRHITIDISCLKSVVLEDKWNCCQWPLLEECQSRKLAQGMR